ncbi:zinc-finger domain-containing protein [Salinarimonas sp.]|uniref:zinc-finger domain-containing protein n=1 Tax=Salinarimonas sp. TaxID=2766526 RepID=UPI0032D99F46
MAEKTTPHFANDAGVPIIHIGAKEFMCIGAKPPFDHPHEFLDMGAEDEIICPYCSTLFRYRADLTTEQSDPPECLWTGGALDIASAHTGPSR